MSNSGNAVDLVRDVMVPVGLTIYKYFYPEGSQGIERMVINLIPNSQVRSGPVKQNNDLINVNYFVPKINDGTSVLPDSERIEEIDDLIQTAFDSFNGVTTRVGYSNLNAQPKTVFSENDKENFINIRVEATYT